jgi:thioredoxin-dependent peroxiredoxin
MWHFRGSAADGILRTSTPRIASVKPTLLQRCLLASIVLAAAATSASAQATAVATPAVTLKVGDVAPDFDLRGATRYGLLATPTRLSDLKGETVVIAFFYKARTKG